jgi:uncharacterized protein (DUF2236 family)
LQRDKNQIIKILYKAAIWVWATLLDYTFVIYEIFVRSLSDDEKEDHYQSQRQSVGVWGLTPDHLPPNYPAFMDYCQGYISIDNE